MTSIKYEKAIVIWEDINSCDSAWNSQSDLENLKPAMCNTIGYLYEDNPNFIKMFATYSIDPNTDELDVGDAIVIPKGCVVSIKKLEN